MNATFDCFRVRPDGQVENWFDVRVMDQVGYVPVGGVDLPYIHLDDELLNSSRSAGNRINKAAAILVPPRRICLAAAPTPDSLEFEEKHALVLLPSKSVFAFRHNGQTPVRGIATYIPDNVALLTLMKEGDRIEATPVARRLQDQQPGLAVVYDGHSVSCLSRAQAA